MRQVLSLSLPATHVQQIKYLSKKRGHASVSSYIKYLVQTDEDSVSDAELLEVVRQSRKEYQSGKTKKAKSIADLL